MSDQSVGELARQLLMRQLAVPLLAVGSAMEWQAAARRPAMVIFAVLMTVCVVILERHTYAHTAPLHGNRRMRAWWSPVLVAVGLVVLSAGAVAEGMAWWAWPMVLAMPAWWSVTWWRDGRDVEREADWAATEGTRQQEAKAAFERAAADLVNSDRWEGLQK